MTSVHAVVTVMKPPGMWFLARILVCLQPLPQPSSSSPPGFSLLRHTLPSAPASWLLSLPTRPFCSPLCRSHHHCSSTGTRPYWLGEFSTGSSQPSVVYHTGTVLACPALTPKYQDLGDRSCQTTAGYLPHNVDLPQQYPTPPHRVSSLPPGSRDPPQSDPCTVCPGTPRPPP